MKNYIVNKNNINLLNKIFLLILFSFPFIIILGSAAINIATAITSIIFLFVIVKKIEIDFFKNKLLIYLIAFFFFIFLNTLIHNQGFALILKSLANYRYLILTASVYLALDFSSEKTKKIFIYFNLCLVVLVGLDIVYQYIFQKNIFGFAPGYCDEFEKNCERFSGVFNDELIAGGYLAQTGILVFFLLQIIKKKSYFDKVIEIFFVLFLFIVILLTGERNAIIIFSLSFIFFYIFQKKYLKLILVFFSFVLLFFIFSKKIDHLNKRFFYIAHSWGNIYHAKDSDLKEKILYSPWMLHYRAAIELFLERPFIGHGLKSFRVLCNDTKISKELILRQSRYSACSTHPHNYSLEFLAEHGLIGAAMFFFLILGVFIQILRIRKHQARETIVAIGLGSLLLTIMFPLKPSGSFFSTFNASMLFYIFGFFLYYLKKVK